MFIIVSLFLLQCNILLHDPYSKGVNRVSYEVPKIVHVGSNHTELYTLNAGFLCTPLIISVDFSVI